MSCFFTIVVGIDGTLGRLHWDITFLSILKTSSQAIWTLMHPFFVLYIVRDIPVV